MDTHAPTRVWFSVICLALCADAVTSVQMLKAVSKQGMCTECLAGLCCGHEAVGSGWPHWDSPQEHNKSAGAITLSCNLQPESTRLCASLSTSLCSPAFTSLNPLLLSDC